MNENQSKELFTKSKEVFPGGVNSPVRAFLSVGRTPLFIEKAKGAYLYDVDGNEYIDYVNSWGPCILGHGHPAIVEAVKKAAVDGLSYGAPTKKEWELAQMIRECMPSMEMMRMVSSGTEAVMSAIRVARGFTKRDKIVKFKGCYHGHSDGLLVKAGSGALTQAMPDSEGVPGTYTEHTLLAEYNHKDSVEALFQSYKGEIAAVIVEPVAANMGLVLPMDNFLPFLREITKKHGALLIFDEVITGFRLGLGGAQEYYQVKPDLTTLGKIVGGGMPMGVYGGRKDVMEVVAPVGGVYQAGTLSGNPIATAAGIATLKQLRDQTDFYRDLKKKADVLANTMKTYLNGVCVNQVESLLGMFFTETQVVDYESALTSDTKRYAKYFTHMIEHGIYVAPSQFEVLFLSGAHTDLEIDKTCSVIKTKS